MISAAACLTHPNYKVRSILCAILRDEIITWYRRLKSSDKLMCYTQILQQSAQIQNLDPLSAEHAQTQLAISLSNIIAQPDFPEIGGEELVRLVNKAANSIMSRLSSKSYL